MQPSVQPGVLQLLGVVLYTLSMYVIFDYRVETSPHFFQYGSLYITMLQAIIVKETF